MDQKLGRGLSALFGELENDVDNAESSAKSVINVDIDLISPNANQPRKFFDDDKINELASSIKLHGILQPIAVRHNGNMYEIVAGERRWRAAKVAGLKQVPVHIVECKDSDILALALIENIQRSDLNPIEESEAIKTLISNCECRQEDLSAIIGKSRSYISNAIRLLSLPESVQKLIRTGELSAGHGKCLVGMQNADEVAELAVKEGWSVRQLESALKNMRSGASTDTPKIEMSGINFSTPIESYQDPDAAAIADRISRILNVSAKLKITKKGGVLTLTCNSCEALENLTSSLLTLNEFNES